MPPNAPVFDPRFNNLVVSLSYLRAGNLPASRDLTLMVANGEGQTWLDPAVTPTIGTVTSGTLVVASESFPRFAPLTLTLTGGDLFFLVRQSLVLHFGVAADGETALRLPCASPWTAASSYRLRRPPGDPERLRLLHVNAADKDGLTQKPRETPLEIHVRKGSIVEERPEPFRKTPDGLITANRVELRRHADGELKLRLHAARMECDFANGVMTGLRVYDGRGPIANLRLLDLSGAGVGVSAGFMDTLP